MLIITFLCHIPFSILLMFLVETEHFGRKNSFIYGFSFNIVLCGSLPFVSNVHVVFVLFVILLGSMSMQFVLLYLYLPEIYETEIRSMSIGFIQLICRSAGSLSIYLVLALFDSMSELPFVFIGAVQIVALVVAVSLPYDSRMLKLDSHVF